MVFEPYNEKGTTLREKGTTLFERGTLLPPPVPAPLPKPSPTPTPFIDLVERERKDAIIHDTHAIFEVHENPSAKANADPWYSRKKEEQVTEYSQLIEVEARRKGLDPDFVKAVVWMETTHGWYDEITGLVKEPKTIRPMNIHVDYWKGLGYSRNDLQDPMINIEVGAFLLAEIWKRTKDPTPEKVATLYNDLGARKVSDYGKTVIVYYRSRPWLPPPPPPIPAPLPTPPLPTPTPYLREHEQENRKAEDSAANRNVDYVGQYCTVRGCTQERAEKIDQLCGQAKEWVECVLDKIRGVSVETGDVLPSDVANALDRHFHIDVQVAHGIGIYAAGMLIRNIVKVFEKMKLDFNGGMIYICETGKWNPYCRQPLYVHRINPKVVHICPRFFDEIGSELLQRVFLLHESVHFASRLPGAPNTIPGFSLSEVYRFENPEKYRKLSTYSALRNADSYAHFAWELCEPGTFVFD